MEEIELKKLMASMTQEEKLAQLTQLYPLNGSAGQKANEAGPLGKLHIEQNWLHLVGSTLYVTRAEDAFSVQEKHLSQNQHQIPLLFMAGIIHGMETIFPVPLAMACSFDPALIEEACRMQSEIAKFITGMRSLDTFDAYLEECRDMGSDELNDIYDKYYQDYLENTK